MKALLLATALLTTLPALPAFGRDIPADDVYYLEVPRDIDVKVVQWTPPGFPDMVCMYATGGNDGGVTCFRKEPEPVRSVIPMSYNLEDVKL